MNDKQSSKLPVQFQKHLDLLEQADEHWNAFKEGLSYRKGCSGVDTRILMNRFRVYLDELQRIHEPPFGNP